MSWLLQSSRWSRQLIIPQFGPETQRRLSRARVVIFGVGGVGCPAALYLAAAGIGTLVLVDADVVELSNLNRQILYRTNDLGKSKAEMAAAFLKELDPALNVEIIAAKVGFSEIESLVRSADAVMNGFDINRDRFSVNDACVRRGVFAVHNFVENFSGQLVITVPSGKGCLRCLLDERYPEQKPVPVIGVAAAQAGVLAAAEIICFLGGTGGGKTPRRIFFDLAGKVWTVLPVEQNPGCPACGGGAQNGKDGISRER